MAHTTPYRILHVIPQFPYFGTRTVVGGHASCLLTLALAQAAEGHDVTILSYVESGPASQEIEPRLRVHSLFENARPGTVTFGLRFRSAAARWAAERRDRFDVVHCHSGFADYLLVAARLKRDLGLPTLHTMYCPIPRAGGRWRWPIVHGTLRRAASRLDAVIAMSENVAGSLRDYGIDDVKIVGPPVDLERFRPGDDHAATDARRELGLGDDDVAVLFVGNAKPQKNLSGLLRAMHIVRDGHPQARLVATTELAQSSAQPDLAALRREAETLGVADDMIQLGIVDDMPRLMQACDILAAPFLDSFGPSDYFMAVLEGMACGKPTVVSAVGGMPEVIDAGTGRLVDPHDEVAIADAIQDLVESTAARESAGTSARRFAETHFDPPRISGRYRALYDEVARA
jgi:glycosyltransferase involved in cell wall biosynthesis